MRAFRCLLILATLCCVPSLALAQSPPDWTMKVRLGKKIYVTMLNGDRVEGVAGSVTVDGLSVASVAGMRTVKFEEIRRVEKPDSVWNGVWIGVGVGLAAGVLIDSKNPCDPDNTIECQPVTPGAMLLGGLLGWAVDGTMKGRTKLFDGRVTPKVAVSSRRGGFNASVALAW